MSIDPGNEHIERMNREAARESGPNDPKATKPRDANRLLVIVAAALAIAVVALAGMFFHNVKYDGTSPAPVAERR